MPEVLSVVIWLFIVGLMEDITQGLGLNTTSIRRTVFAHPSHSRTTFDRGTADNRYHLYSQWSDWSDCSTSCGQGIAKRRRSCRKWVINSGGQNSSMCHGDMVEHKTCKSQVCPSDSLDFRLFQCSQYNGRSIAGQSVRVWVPADEGANPCELRCTGDEGFDYVFGKVADGTLCSRGVCLDGRCLSVGCNGKIGSPTKLDMCGVCGGRNATCVHYRDTFTAQPSVHSNNGRHSDYHEVAVIPVDARNVRIWQDAGENVLALRTRESAYLFHGDLNKFRSGKRIAGTIVRYTGNNVTEILEALGPTNADIYLLVLLLSRNPGVQYEYWLPLPSQNQHGHMSHEVTMEQHSTRPHTSSTRLTTSFSARPHAQLSSRLTQKQTEASTSSVSLRSDYMTASSVSFNYGPKRRGLMLPETRTVSSVSTTSDVSMPMWQTSSEGKGLFTVVPIMNYKTPKPLYNYYEKFRKINSPQPLILRSTKSEQSQQLQGDSSDAHNVQLNATGPTQNRNSSKYTSLQKQHQKRRKVIFPIDKSKSRWEYRLNGHTNGKQAERFVSTPVSIAVLPLPDKKDQRTKFRNGKKSHKCTECQRIKNQRRHFCSSDFVIHATVVDYEFLHGETRYELEILQSFKNKMALLAREYVWSPDTCRCPKLRLGKEYVLMGKADGKYRRNESRLVVDRHCFVRLYNPRQGKKLLKLKKEHNKKCSVKVS